MQRIAQPEGRGQQMPIEISSAISRDAKLSPGLVKYLFSQIILVSVLFDRVTSDPSIDKIQHLIHALACFRGHLRTLLYLWMSVLLATISMGSLIQLSNLGQRELGM